MIIVLLGPPGAGKGTQARQIEARYGLTQISTGDLFRAAMKDESPLGRSVKGYLVSGNLVPDEVTSAVVEARITKPDCAKGFMLDGFPRTIPQAKALDVMLSVRKLALDAVLYFDISEETAIERLSGRRLCGKCNENYHQKFMPPRVPGVCDRCGGSLVQRPDDSTETIRERLKVYTRQTSALVEEYEKRGLLRKIGADGSTEEVTDAAVGILDRISSGSRA